MKKLLGLVLVLLCVSSTAYAETLVVFQSYGLSEFDGKSTSPKPCEAAIGKKMRQEISNVMMGGMLISFSGESVKFLQRAEERYRSKVSKADIAFTATKDGGRFGIWSLDEGARSLVIQVGPVRKGIKFLPKEYRPVTITLLIEADAKTRNKVACFERWSGIAEVR